MLKFFKVLFILSFFLIALPASVNAQDTGWVIDRFKVDINIQADTTVAVTETIAVDFFNLQKHGIFRIIPVKYKDKFGQNLNIKFKLLSITDAGGAPISAQQSQEGKNIKLKIGDPDVTISGKQTYVIRYQVQRVITTPDSQAELYWNVTGTDWPVPISAVHATASAPSSRVLDTICFTGYFGSQAANCTTKDGAFSTINLNPGEGLTIAVALDKSGFTFPSLSTRILWTLQDNIFYFIPFFTFGLMFYLYWTRGRDQRTKDMVDVIPLVYSPPKDLSAGEVGVLIDEKVHLQDITATVIDLARRGFFTITEIPKKGLFGKLDFEFKRLKQSTDVLHQFEQEVIIMLFDDKQAVKLSKLPTSAYRHLDQAKSKLYQHLTTTGYFSANPKTVRTLYLIIGIIIAGISLFGLFNLSLFIGLLFSGLIILAFSFFMPARTPKGREALRQTLGLKEWVRLGAWRERIHEKHNFLEEVLPFAIAFGLTEKFLNSFRASDLKKLSWYKSDGTLTASHFNHSLGRLNYSVNSGVAATRPRSSASSDGSGFSGGSSGGGFGGGGGGSW